MIAECGMRNAECGIFEFGIRNAESRSAAAKPRKQSAIRNPQSAFRNRHGISLIEVLISMFVLLFGLMGVAAIFPVGNYYVVEGEKHDQGQLLAANAFEEIQARGMLRPELWLYASRPATNAPTTNDFTIQQSNLSPPPNKTRGYFNMPLVSPVGDDTYPHGPGRAFVIDPMSVATANSNANLDTWPLAFNASGVQIDPNNPWSATERWPVRRLTLPQAGGVPLDSQVAEVIFRLRDDLTVEMPERDDAPSFQLWRTADIDNSGNANNTPDNPTDDTLLSRQYHGNFSWLATIVPPTEQAHEGLQPVLRQGYPYEVSVVVFYKRVPTPSAETERLLQAEMLPGGELVMYGGTIDEVDKSLEGIKSGAWVAVMGVNRTTDAFMLKWYRLLALDEETDTQTNHGYQIKSQTNSTLVLRRAMVIGPDWPEKNDSMLNLRVAILPGIASVVTREMVLERESMWNAD